MVRRFPTYIIAFFCAASVLFSCSDNAGKGYRIVCNVSKDVEADSIMLFEYEDDYDAVRLCGTQHINQNRSAIFNGRVNKPKVAYIQLGKFSFAGRYYFIMDNNDITIRIGNGHLKIQGGELNNEYFEAFAERRGIINKKNSLLRQYKKLAADSAITDSIDRQFQLSHQQLSDSLQRLYRRVLMRNDLVSAVMWTQYGNEVSVTDDVKNAMMERPDIYKLVR